MDEDLFADTTYGKLALAKIKPADVNFRLYFAGWMGDERQVMEVRGAVFRKALRGPRTGRLSILVKGTGRTAYITADELQVNAKAAAVAAAGIEGAVQWNG